MSDFLHHEPCPKCRDRGADRSGNNLAVYTDHKYCFSCGLWQPTQPQFHTVELEKVEKINVGNTLPDDYSSNIRLDALVWIKRYGITQKEIETHHIGWSPDKELLIFPILGPEGDLLMWQGRYFGKNPKYPKYNTKGYKQDVYHIIHPGNNSDSIVVTEDLLSAIKVGRQNSAMPLWGSSIVGRQGIVLSRQFKNLVIWLDNDKKMDAVRFSQKLGLLFDKVKVVISDKDPKEYTDEQIKEFLRVAN